MYFSLALPLHRFQEPDFGPQVDYSGGLVACGFSTQNAGTWTIQFEVNKHTYLAYEFLRTIWI